MLVGRMALITLWIQDETLRLIRLGIPFSVIDGGFVVLACESATGIYFCCLCVRYRRLSISTHRDFTAENCSARSWAQGSSTLKVRDSEWLVRENAALTLQYFFRPLMPVRISAAIFLPVC